jgi:hypothetical protein
MNHAIVKVWRSKSGSSSCETKLLFSVLLSIIHVWRKYQSYVLSQSINPNQFTLRTLKGTIGPFSPSTFGRFIIAL